ncbi:MAG: molybdenum cofactor biosynthesis protein B [Bilophila wadsworthia]
MITLSDKGAAGLRVDESGPLMAADTRAKLPLCHEQGFMIPDDPQTLRPLVMELALGQGYDLILTSGGTGLAPRDTTPEALLPIFERRLPGFEQAMMQASLAKTPTAAISRAVAGTLGRTIVITLPGSRKAVSENLAAILPALGHALEKLHGDPSDCGKRA